MADKEKFGKIQQGRNKKSNLFRKKLNIGI